MAYQMTHYYQGGFDYDFVSEIDPIFECPICLLCTRDPYQVYQAPTVSFLINFIYKKLHIFCSSLKFVARSFNNIFLLPVLLNIFLHFDLQMRTAIEMTTHVSIFLSI